MRLWVIMLILAVAGCRTVDQSVTEPTVPQAPEPPNSTASSPASPVKLASAEIPLQPEAVKSNDPLPISTIKSNSVPAGQPEPIERPVGSVRLTLANAIETALQANPSLVALRQDEPVSQAALRAARSYPHDPSVQVTVQPSPRFAGGETGSAVNAVQILQTIELAHQPRYRCLSGMAQLDATRWNIVTAELRSVAETERRFFTVLYRRKSYEIKQSLADLNADLLGVLQRRYDAGLASAADVSLAAMEAHSSGEQAELAKLALQFAVLDLQAYMGLDRDTPCEIAGDIDDWSWRPAEVVFSASLGNPEASISSEQVTSDNLVNRMAAFRPDVRAANADLQTAKAEAKLALASCVPNLDFGPAYERNEDETVFWGFTAQMSVPVFSSTRTRAAERHTQLQQKQVVLQQHTRQATIEIKTALGQYERALTLVDKIPSNDDAQLIQQLQAVEDLYEAGQVDLLRVFTARTQALQVRMARLEALNSLAQAGGNLIEASGIRPELLPLLLHRIQPRPSGDLL